MSLNPCEIGCGRLIRLTYGVIYRFHLSLYAFIFQNNIPVVRISFVNIFVLYEFE